MNRSPAWGWSSPSANGSGAPSRNTADPGEMRMKRQALEKLLNSQASQLGISDAQLNLSGIRDQLRSADDATVASMKPSDFLASTQDELRKQWPAQIQLAAMRNASPQQPAAIGSFGTAIGNGFSSWTAPGANSAQPQPPFAQDPTAGLSNISAFAPSALPLGNDDDDEMLNSILRGGANY